MLRRTTIGTIASLAVLTASSARAQVSQTAQASPRELTLAFGVAHNERVDQVISPSIYGGSGFDALLRYRKPLFGADVSTAMRGGWRNLGTDATSATSEMSVDGELRIDVMQRLSSGHSLFRPALGVGAQVTSVVTDHRYAIANNSDKAFVFGVAAVGPVARWDASLGSSRTSMQLGLPLTGIVVHPYSAIRAGHPLFEPHAFSPATLRQPDMALSYVANARAGMSLFGEYRASATRYDNVLPIRAFSQSLYLGFVRRGGSK